VSNNANESEYAMLLTACLNRCKESETCVGTVVAVRWPSIFFFFVKGKEKGAWLARFPLQGGSGLRLGWIPNVKDCVHFTETTR